MTDTTQLTLEVKNLDSPDQQRSTEHGVLDVVNLTGATIVKGVLQPGWKWSSDVKPQVGTDSCQVAHAGYIISGRFHVRMDDGRDYDLGPGDAHVVAPGHDAWVVGDEPCVVIDFAATGNPVTGRVGRCPCGVEFRVASDEQLDHLVAAIREHARGAHDHQLTAEDVLTEVTAS